MKTKLLYLHFVLLAVVLLNWGCKIAFDFGLHHYLYFALRVIWYMSGLVLFILYLKPFQKKVFYFFVYWFLFMVGSMMEGLDIGIRFFGLGIIAMLFWHTFYPNITVFKDKTYEVVQLQHGFMGSCCHYEINKNYYFMFEKRIVQLREVDEIQFFEVDETKKRAYFSGKYIDLP